MSNEKTPEKGTPPEAPKEPAQQADTNENANLPVLSNAELTKMWDELSWKDRTKLRVAYPVGVLTHSITRDLVKHKWLNLAFVGISLIPGPGGILFLPALMLSYGVRWDKDAIATRRKMINLVTKDVPVKDYADIIKPAKDNPDHYYVDTGALAKKKFTAIKDSVIKVNKTAADQLPVIYEKNISTPFTKAANGFKKPLGRVIGQDRADKTITAVFNAKAKTESGVKSSVAWVSKTYDSTTEWGGRQLKDGFNAAARTKNATTSGIDTGLKAIGNGWESSKNGVKKLFGRKPKP